MKKEYIDRINSFCNTIDNIEARALIDNFNSNNDGKFIFDEYNEIFSYLKSNYVGNYYKLSSYNDLDLIYIKNIKFNIEKYEFVFICEQYHFNGYVTKDKDLKMSTLDYSELTYLPFLKLSTTSIVSYTEIIKQEYVETVNNLLSKLMITYVDVNK